MGVRGLTSYIARNAELYLEPFELHDCNLVIDGDNLACNLYKSASRCNSAFGGDYDIYYRSVKDFFEVLLKCNVRPFVLMDGGYELKKMRAVEKRVRSRIASIKYINPSYGTSIVFPLMMREVFVDAIRDCGEVPIMRCIFEADDELAILARKLDCPVLSYDSDFYIHNVKYIPLATLTPKVLEKKANESQYQKSLSHTRAKHMKKRLESSKALKTEIYLDTTNTNKGNKEKTIHYIDCCLYKIENLTSNKKIRKDLLPLFAALLGNDYIQSSLFRKFYAHIGMKGISKKISKQQRRIRAILKWLRYETKESALEKILSRMKTEKRENLLAQIESATDGYNRENSEAFRFFGLNEENIVKDVVIDEDDVEEETYEEVESGSNETSESSEGEEEYYPDVENPYQDEDKSVCNFGEDENPERQEVLNKFEGLRGDKDFSFPDWFQQRIRAAELPRFLIDLFYLGLYINNPQIENFLLKDCNEVAIPILLHIFSLITYPETYELRYLTRVVRLTKAHYKRLKSVSPLHPFDPFATDLNALKVIFPHDKFNTDELFEEIQKIPSNLRLYMLAVVYWSTNAEDSNVLHFYALIVCLVVLSGVDCRFLTVRDEKLFNKKFGKLIQSGRKPITKAEGTDEKGSCIMSRSELNTRKAEEKLKDLSPEKKVKFLPKLTSILVQQRLLKYFNFPENLRKRHNDFSSSILHGFSEFQSVVYAINTLNTLVNKPFEPIKISEMYSGVFLYNLYTGLRNRTDFDYFIKNFIFPDSIILFDYYNFFIKWCTPFVRFLKTETFAVEKPKKKSKRMAKKSNETTSILLNIGVDMIDDTSDQDDFNDLNNKFYSLL